MIFTTKIAGIPCKCEVLHHISPQPMRFTGSGSRDMCIPVLKNVEFHILDMQGHKAPWLAKQLTQEDDLRLRDEFQAAAFAHKYGIDF